MSKRKAVMLYVLMFVCLVGFIAIFVFLLRISISQNIPNVGSNDSIISILFSMSSFLLGTGIIFGLVKWFYDQYENDKKLFLNQVDNFVQEIINEKNVNKEFYTKLRGKEIYFRMEDYDSTLSILHFLEQEQIDFFYNSKITSSYFFIIHLIYSNKRFLEEPTIFMYVKTKFILLGNTDLYYILFSDILLQFNQNLREENAKEYLEQYLWLKNVLKKDKFLG